MVNANPLSIFCRAKSKPSNFRCMDISHHIHNPSIFCAEQGEDRVGNDQQSGFGEGDDIKLHQHSAGLDPVSLSDAMPGGRSCLQ